VTIEHKQRRNNRYYLNVREAEPKKEKAPGMTTQEVIDTYLLDALCIVAENGERLHGGALVKMMNDGLAPGFNGLHLATLVRKGWLARDGKDVVLTDRARS
jgi:hypothetical protein